MSIMENPKDLDLPPCAEEILQEMFPTYGRVVIKAELGGGLSGGRVFLVRAIKIQDDVENPILPAVVKMAHRTLIEKEWDAYIENIHYQLSGIAEIRGAPVYPSGCDWGGLCYPLLGAGTFDVISLREFLRTASLDKIEVLFDRLIITMKQLLDKHDRKYEIDLRPSFDRLLPVNLLITPQPLPQDAQPHLITPETYQRLVMQASDFVRLEGFVVKKVDLARRTVTLNLPQFPAKSYTLRLREIDDAAAFQLDQVIPPLEGVIFQTRQIQFQTEAQQALGPQVDLTVPTILLSDGTTLPNPLTRLPQVLEQFSTVSAKIGPIHGDLNPENIVTDRDLPNPSLIDFAEARQDYILHDFFRLETEIMTKVVPEILRRDNLSAAVMVPNFYEQLHGITFHRSPQQTHPPHPALEKPFVILKIIRQEARTFLLEQKNCSEYYRGLFLYLLGALKFRNLSEAPEAPLPKQVAFWGAAAIAKLLDDLAKGAWEPPELPLMESPYRGLEAFREEDADFFFGRDDFVQDLFEAVHKQALVVVIGPSGSGKSSVVQAGLIPRLRQEKNWLIATFHPGNRPFLELSRSLAPFLMAQAETSAQLGQINKLADDLQAGVIELSEVVEEVIARNYGRRFLLVVDQFEELYTQLLEEMTRLRFLDTLLAALNTPPSNQPPDFVLVITLRSDFLDQVQRYGPFTNALQHGPLKLIRTMEAADLIQAIEKPAEKRGTTFEAGLVNRILEDVGQESGSLPLLEFALHLLWDRQRQRKITHQSYDEIGGVGQALANHAERVYARFSTDQGRLQRIFLQLVQPGQGTRDTPRRANRADIGDDNWDLAVRLAGADARLLVTGHQETLKSGNVIIEETVEIVHDALIKNWKRLQIWINESRDFRLWQEHLRLLMLQWEEKKRDEDLLLRGSLLTDAKRWLAKREIDILPKEHAFIQASGTLREREIKAQKEREQEDNESRKRKEEADRILDKTNRELERERQEREKERELYGASYLDRFVRFIGSLVVVGILLIAGYFARQYFFDVPIPTPDMRLPEGTLFQDEFNSNINGWSEAISDEDAYVMQREIVDSKYRIWMTSKEPNARGGSYVPTLFGKGLFAAKNFQLSLEVNVVETSVDPEKAYIWISFQNKDAFYYIFFGTDGRFWVNSWDNGKTTTLYGPTFSNSISLSTNSPNVLEILVKDAVIVIYANGQEIATLKNATSDAAGLIALGIGLNEAKKYLSVDFDNIIIKEVSDVDMTIAEAAITQTQAMTTRAPGIIFEDYFDTNANGWDLRKDSNNAYAEVDSEIVNGKLRRTLTSKQDVTWGQQVPTKQNYGDFVLSVEIVVVDISANVDEANFAIRFRKNDNGDYYLAKFTTKGYYKISMFRNEKWEDIQEWTFSDAIKLDRGGPNSFDILAKDSTFTIYANEEILTTVYNNALTGAGKIDLVLELFEANQTLVVEFDNLVIKEPPDVIEDTSPMVTAVNNVNIRSGPDDENYPVVGTFYSGNTAPIIGYNSDRRGGIWWKISMPQVGSETWVANRVVRAVNTENIPLSPKPSSPVTPTPVLPVTPTPMLPQIFATINGQAGGTYSFGELVEFCFWTNSNLRVKAIIIEPDEEIIRDLGEWPGLASQKECIRGPMSVARGSNKLRITAWSDTGETISDREIEFVVR